MVRSSVHPENPAFLDLLLHSMLDMGAQDKLATAYPHYSEFDDRGHFKVVSLKFTFRSSRRLGAYYFSGVCVVV